MAQSYYINEALTLAGAQLNRKLEDNYGPYIANVALAKIWNKYDWRETLAALPPFYLIPGEQEYGAPATIIPTDFQGLREVYLARLSGDPVPRQEMRVHRDVRLTNAQSLPNVIGYEPSTRRFRVFPRPSDGIGATDWLIDGTYKKRPAKLTPSTLQTTLVPWDDLYFPVFVAAIKWAALDTAGDPRAGQILNEKGQSRYSGQLGLMHDAIDEMAANEGLNLGDPSIAPYEPLVIKGNDYLSGLGYF